MAYGPPPFMPYEPFLLGVGVVFNLLNMGPWPVQRAGTSERHHKVSLWAYGIPLCDTSVASLDERQITHLMSARLKYDLYDFSRGWFGPASFLLLV